MLLVLIAVNCLIWCEFEADLIFSLPASNDVTALCGGMHIFNASCAHISKLNLVWFSYFSPVTQRLSAGLWFWSNDYFHSKRLMAYMIKFHEPHYMQNICFDLISSLRHVDVWWKLVEIWLSYYRDANIWAVRALWTMERLCQFASMIVSGDKYALAIKLKKIITHTLTVLPIY